MKKNIAAIKRNVVFVLLMCFSLISCEDVIQADLETGEAKVVIDAEIVWQKGTDGSQQTIKISRMASYYSPETPKVSGAQVHVENSTGIQFIFSETEPGVYTCSDFIPVLNETYTLYAAIDGEVYTATETLMPVPEIDHLEQTDNGGFTADETEVAVYFTDSAQTTDYYLISFISPTLPYPSYDLTDDELTNGNTIKSDFSDADLQAGDVMEITVRGTSHQFYNYMNLILEASDSNPFSTPPANINGNILNQNSNGSQALGYFRLCESDYRIYTIE
jgi:Domain of unknown function (DUF4249)